MLNSEAATEHSPSILCLPLNAGLSKKEKSCPPTKTKSSRKLRGRKERKKEANRVPVLSASNALPLSRANGSQAGGKGEAHRPAPALIVPIRPFCPGRRRLFGTQRYLTAKHSEGGGKTQRCKTSHAEPSVRVGPLQPDSAQPRGCPTEPQQNATRDKETAAGKEQGKPSSVRFCFQRFSPFLPPLKKRYIGSQPQQCGRTHAFTSPRIPRRLLPFPSTNRCEPRGEVCAGNSPQPISGRPASQADLPHPPLPLPAPGCLKQFPHCFTRLLSRRRAREAQQAPRGSTAPQQRGTARAPRRVSGKRPVRCVQAALRGARAARRAGEARARHRGVQIGACRSYSRRSTVRSHACSRGFGRAQRSMWPGPQRVGGRSVRQPRNLSPTAPSFHPTYGRYRGRLRAPLSPTGARRSGGGRRRGRDREGRGVPERSAERGLSPFNEGG